MELTAANVNIIMSDCLFKNGESHENHVTVEGIVSHVEFHPERLESHRNDVLEMLGELDQTFLVNVGGGWSFLQLCNKANGEQWTGMHSTMDELCMLAIGLGIGQWLLPRDIWSMLPGGMPYIAFTI